MNDCPFPVMERTEPGLQEAFFTSFQACLPFCFLRVHVRQKPACSLQNDHFRFQMNAESLHDIRLNLLCQPQNVLS